MEYHSVNYQNIVLPLNAETEHNISQTKPIEYSNPNDIDIVIYEKSDDEDNCKPLNNNNDTVKMDKVQVQQNPDIINRITINYKICDKKDGKTSTSDIIKHDQGTLTHSNLLDGDFSTTNKSILNRHSYGRNKLNLEKCVEVIQGHDLKNSYQNLAIMFDLLHIEILEIISQRETILQTHEDNSSDISEKREQILKAYDDGKTSYKELAIIFHCSLLLINLTLLPANRPNIIKDVDKIPKCGATNKKYCHWKKFDPKKGIDGKISYDELGRKFNYSTEQIKKIVTNRDKISEYQEETSQIVDNDSGNDGNHWNHLDLKNQVEIIKAYDRKCSYNEISNKFCCSYFQTNKILSNRDTILKAYTESQSINKLDQRSRVEVIKLFNESKISCLQLSKIFNCSYKQIGNILKNRELILREYERRIPRSSDNCQKTYYINSEPSTSDIIKHDQGTLTHSNILDGDFSTTNKSILNRHSYGRNKLNLEKCVEVIQGHDLKNSYQNLAIMFDLLHTEILEIISQRETILQTHEDNSSDISEKREQILKAYDDGKTSYKELAIIFHCSLLLINLTLLPDNRPNIIKDVDKIPKCGATNKKYCHWKKFDPKKDIEVIKTYDGKISYDELGRKFNYSTEQIKKIVTNRDKILEYQEETSQIVDNDSGNDGNHWNHLDLKKQVEIIKAYDRKCSYNEISNKFCCSYFQTNKILSNRDTILKAYTENLKDCDYNYANESQSINKLDQRSRVEVIKLFNESKISCLQLSKIFNCSYKQIGNILKNRELILREYERRIPRSSDNCQKTYYINSDDAADNNLHRQFQRSNLNLVQRIEIIEEYNKNASKLKLSRMFNCSMNQIENIVKNQDQILIEYEKWYCEKQSLQVPSSPLDVLFEQENSKLTSNEIINLSLDDCLDVIRAYNRNNFSFYKLSSLFNYSDKQIQFCIANREALIAKYKELHPELDENEMITSDNNKLFLGKHVELLKTYEHDKNYINFIRNRKDIEDFKNPMLKQNYTEIYKALIPLTDYAKMKNNLKALNVLKQLKNYLANSTTINQSKNVLNVSDSKAENIVNLNSPYPFKIPSYIIDNTTNENTESDIFSWKDALIALEHVHDYAKLRKNISALHCVSELKDHLQQIVSKWRKEF